jgi:hypothetical protein
MGMLLGKENVWVPLSEQPPQVEEMLKMFFRRREV